MPSVDARSLACWLDSLRQNPEPEGPLLVGLEPFREPDDLEDLNELDQFVLTAVMIHERLGLGDLVRSLNEAPERVQATCRHLEGMDILCQEPGAEGWRVTTAWRITVRRFLTQKHVLHQV